MCRPPNPLPPSQLFTLRLWCEALGDGRAEWRGQITHLGSGEVRYFRNAESFQALLRRMWVEMLDTGESAC